MTAEFPRTYAGFIVLAVILCIPIISRAQTDSSNERMRNSENAVFVLTEPAHPSAGDRVHLKAESPIIDLSKSYLTWRSGGKIIAQGTGVTEADVAISAAGTPLQINVDVSDSFWGEATKSLTISPVELDLLYDAPTYVPPFYRGRSLPSAGTVTRLQALARFTKSGSSLSESQIIYTWSKNGRVLGSLSGAGKSTLSIEAPALFSSDTVSVRATSKDEVLSASASVTIPSTESYVALYQDHPLYGFMYHKMVESVASVPDREMTFAVVPYFASARSPEDTSLEYHWSVDNSPVAASTTNKSLLTIRAGSSGSVAALKLEISHASNIFMSAAGSWAITFGGSSGSTNAGPDIFHSN